MEMLVQVLFFSFVSFWASNGTALMQQFLYSFIFSYLLLAHFKGLHGTLPQVAGQQNIRSLYLSKSCHCFVDFFFDFSMATSCWG